MRVEPYLSFEGRCEEAIEFYQKAVGAEVQKLLRFKDCPMPANADCTPPDGNKVMHASLRIGDSLVMASDGQCNAPAKFSGTALSLSVRDDAEAKRAFNALSDGGQVGMPLTKTFFSSSFGMVTDRFGVPWMIVVMP